MEMAYVFFILLALVVTQQKTAESSEDNSFNLTRTSWSLPDFSNSNRGKNALLVETEPWIPSRTTQLTFLTPRQSLKVELELNRDAQESVIESCDLLFKCNAGETTVKTLNLISNDTNHQWKVSEPLCTYELGFAVERHNATSYRIKILPESKVPFNQSLEHNMEFSISIRYKQGTLTSATLYAFSLVSLFNINPEKTSSSQTFKRYFLTEKAIAFLMGRLSDLQLKLDEPVVKIDFLEKGLLDVIKKAPSMIGTLLTVTVSLKVSYNHSASEYRRYLISNSEDIFTRQSDANSYGYNNYVRHGLSLATGQLLIDRSFLRIISEEWEGTTVDVTLRVSLNGLRNSSQVKRSVVNYNGAFRNIVLPSISDVKHQLECPSVETWNVSVIPYYTGMRDLVLTSPVVCPKLVSYKKVQDYTATVDYDCDQNCPAGQLRRVRRLEDNSKIIIQGLVSEIDLGRYYFTAKDMPPHTYELVEGNLPIIATLPDVVNANKYAILELECKAPRPGENYKFIHMSMYFRVMEAYSAERWHDVTVDEFATKLLRVSPSKIRKVRLKKQSREFGYKLHLPMFHLSGKWRLNFVCRAKTDGPEVKSTFGIPLYESEVVTPIRYYEFGDAEVKYVGNTADSLLSQASAVKVACFAVTTVAVVRSALLHF